MIIGHPATNTVGPVIWHGHVPERTVTRVKATHIHLIHVDEGVAEDSPSIAMGCDVEKGWKDISAKDSLVVVEVWVPSRTKLTGTDEGRGEWCIVRGDVYASPDYLPES